MCVLHGHDFDKHNGTDSVGLTNLRSITQSSRLVSHIAKITQKIKKEGHGEKRMLKMLDILKSHGAKRYSELDRGYEEL